MKKVIAVHTNLTPEAPHQNEFFMGVANPIFEIEPSLTRQIRQISVLVVAGNALHALPDPMARTILSFPLATVLSYITHTQTLDRTLSQPLFNPIGIDTPTRGFLPDSNQLSWPQSRWVITLLGIALTGFDIWHLVSPDSQKSAVVTLNQMVAQPLFSTDVLTQPDKANFALQFMACILALAVLLGTHLVLNRSRNTTPNIAFVSVRGRSLNRNYPTWGDGLLLSTGSLALSEGIATLNGFSHMGRILTFGTILLGSPLVKPYLSRLGNPLLPRITPSNDAMPLIRHHRPNGEKESALLLLGAAIILASDVGIIESESEYPLLSTIAIRIGALGLLALLLLLLNRNQRVLPL